MEKISIEKFLGKIRRYSFRNPDFAVALNQTVIVRGGMILCISGMKISTRLTLAVI